MNFSFLDKKLIDSTTNMIQFMSNVVLLKKDRDKILIQDFVEITEALAMKIDLISKKYYGTADDAWIIGKYNGISNLLAMPVGLKLIIPEKESFLSVVKTIDLTSQIRKFVVSQTIQQNTASTNSRSSINNRNSNTFTNNNGTLTI